MFPASKRPGNNQPRSRQSVAQSPSPKAAPKGDSRPAAVAGSKAIPSLEGTWKPAAAARSVALNDQFVTPPRRPPPADLKQAVGKLSSSKQTQLLGVDAGANGEKAQRYLRYLLDNDAFKKLDPARQGQALDALEVEANLLRSMAGVTAALETQTFAKASAADQAKLIGVGAKSDKADLRTLDRVLMSTDSRGTRLLDSLHALASGPLHPDLAGQRTELVRSSVMEIANTGTIIQGAKGTCSPTVVVIVCAKENPAEFARLVAGLASPAGKVKLMNGDTLERAAGTERPDQSNRTPSQRLLQPAFMDYANGERLYDNAKDAHLGWFGTNTGRGLRAVDQAKLASAVLGQRTISYQSRAGATSLQSLGAVAATVREFLGGVNGSETWTASADLWSKLEAAKGTDTLVSMRWNKGAHAVAVQRIEDGRVYFTNPQGNSGRHMGHIFKADDPPPRRAEDSGSLQSMAVAEFRSRITSVSERAPAAAR